ncbi:Uncharacterized protein Fot_53482 [Forsythia ovata]|uniref:Uncharacterized protein n=1 Tax=Forsythia ovata TaxID=205694 RepID=A0ABD1PMM9_9LAMI
MCQVRRPHLFLPSVKPIRQPFLYLNLLPRRQPSQSAHQHQRGHHPHSGATTPKSGPRFPTLPLYRPFQDNPLPRQSIKSRKLSDPYRVSSTIEVIIYILQILSDYVDKIPLGPSPLGMGTLRIARGTSE